MQVLAFRESALRSESPLRFPKKQAQEHTPLVPPSGQSTGDQQKSCHREHLDQKAAPAEMCTQNYQAKLFLGLWLN